MKKKTRIPLFSGSHCTKQIKANKFLSVNNTSIYLIFFQIKEYFSNKIWRKEQIKVLFYFQDLMKFANIAEGFSKQLFAEEYMQKLFLTDEGGLKGVFTNNKGVNKIFK